MTYFVQRTGRHSHSHKLFDQETQKFYCACGHPKGEKEVSKYRNKSTIYDNVAYHSKKEAEYAYQLDLRLRAKDIKSWTRQVRISLDVNGFHIANYYCDFEVIENDGTVHWIEVKGFETDIFRIKRKLLEALYDKEFESGIKKYTIVK